MVDPSTSSIALRTQRGGPFLSILAVSVLARLAPPRYNDDDDDDMTYLMSTAGKRLDNVVAKEVKERNG